MNFPFKKNRSPAKKRRYGVWVALALVLLTRYVWLPDLWRMPEDRPRLFNGNNGPRFNNPNRFEGQTFAGAKPNKPIPNDLWRLEIEIDSKSMNELRGYHWNGWNGGDNERPTVLATIKNREEIYTNVTVKLKGSAGSFRPIDSKPALTLNFNKEAPGQSFHGLHKLSLNNSVQDQSYLCEAISRELFLEAGVPTPQAKHATVILNGKDLGLYVAVEGYGKHFLKRHFTNTKGNLYDGGFCQEIDGNIQVNSGSNPEDKSDLTKLAKACQTPLADRYSELSKVLDMDEFLRMISMEVITCHWDGYSLNRNNYRMFQNLETKKLLFMPHGMDQMFGTFRSNPTSPISPSMRGMVGRAVLSTKEGKSKYMHTVGLLRTNVFIPEKITARVREIAAGVRPTLDAYNPRIAKDFDRHTESLCSRIEERAESIIQQLSKPGSTLRFDPMSGEAKLSPWSARKAAPRQGTIALQRTKVDNQDYLTVTAKGGATGSWRCPVILEAGQYEFIGQVRGKNIDGSGNSGVCLRASGAQVPYTKVAANQTVTIRFVFSVEQSNTETELVCEARGQNAEAQFELNSLVLRKLQSTIIPQLLEPPLKPE